MAIDPALAWRGFSLLMLGWLAYFFGRTLRPGQDPLITRIARVSNPALPPHLVRYTRRLTGIWCAYFLLAVVGCAAIAPAAAWLGVLVWSGTALLFVGEHWLRPRLFPGERFPGLWQQLRDTLRVWRPVPQREE